MDPVLYLMSNKRRPVRRYPRYDLHDVQGELPVGWCCRCGKEVYTYPADLDAVCEECANEEDML